MLLGHAHPVVTAAVAAAAARGTTFGAPTPGEVLLAEAICERVPGCEQVRLVSSGTEAAMSAVRLARGATGRDRVVKFDGCYHGHSDGLLAGGGSGVAMLGLPGSVGVSAGAVADTEVVPYNVVPELDERVACVIVEPVAANMNLVAPAPGFLEGLRAACDAAGALLIFDEVITGFRLGTDGATGWSGVTPDLWCFGKVIGGGLPVGAFGGRRELMAELAPAGPVYQAGTLSGNPLATAAGLAVLGHVGPADYEALAARVALFAKDLEAAVAAGGLAVAVAGGRAAGRAVPGPGGGGADRAADGLRGRPRPGRQRRLRPLLPRHAAARRGARPGPLRGDVPRAGPRRGRAGPGGRGGGRRRRPRVRLTREAAGVRGDATRRRPTSAQNDRMTASGPMTITGCSAGFSHSQHGVEVRRAAGRRSPAVGAPVSAWRKMADPNGPAAGVL